MEERLLDGESSRKSTGRLRTVVKKLSMGRKSFPRPFRQSSLPTLSFERSARERIDQRFLLSGSGRKHINVTSIFDRESGTERTGTSPEPSEGPSSTTSSSPPAESETWGSLFALREAEDVDAEFSSQLDALADGLLFAEKYKIESTRLQGRPHCRYATEQYTGQRVFLKFFPRGSPEFENAVRMHSSLAAGHRYVCRMVETIEHLSGFPPCLVFEKGRQSLADRMAGRQLSSVEQKAILYSVLESLEYVHSQGITHGNLTPSHIMWFSTDFSWKLVDFEYASQQGEITDRYKTSRYASPEYTQAQQRGEAALRLDPSMDMWSLGVIAFEAFTRSSVVDASTVQKHIDKKLLAASEGASNPAQKWQPANSAGSVERSMEDQFYHFVHALLRRTPHERRKATDALEDALFRSTSRVYHRTDSQERGITDPREMPSLTGCPEWARIAMSNRYLRLFVDLEHLPQDRTPGLPFYMRTGEQAWMFEDDDVPSNCVYCVKLEQTYRLHIRVVPEAGQDIFVDRIISVVVKPPDGDSTSLPVEQRYRDGAVVALALFEPEQLKSQRLQTKSPPVGTTDAKYVKVEVFIKVMVGGSLIEELDYCRTIHCKVINPKSTLRLSRLMGSVKNKGTLRVPFELS